MATTTKEKKKKESLPSAPEATLYNQDGKEAGTLTLPGSLFAVPWNADMVHQVVLAMTSNKRAGTAHTKGRGAVRGGGKKPWRQKGTGRARHGSTRSPIWVGGGVTHGPLAEKNYTRKINKKMKAKALAVLLTKKVRSKEVLFMNALSTVPTKTSASATIVASLKKITGFEKIGKGKQRNTLVVFPKMDMTLLRPFRNLPTVALGDASTMSPLDILEYRFIIIVDPTENFARLEKRVLGK